MKKQNLKNSYNLLVAFLKLEAANWPNTTYDDKIKKILEKAERLRKEL